MPGPFDGAVTPITSNPGLERDLFVGSFGDAKQSVIEGVFPLAPGDPKSRT